MHRVCMIGSGNMGTTMAKLVAENIANIPDFESEVRMYTFDEEAEFQGEKISIVEVINKHHENTKYLPGIKLPSAVVAISDVVKTVEGCDYLILCTPHQFLGKLMKQMIGKFNSNATAISLIKSVSIMNGQVDLFSDFISETLQIPCGALMGANIAHDIAMGEFCESTIAFDDEEIAHRWSPLFHQKHFRIKVINDVVLQQLCGTFKNIYSLGAGFVDGIGMGHSTSAAIIRIGMHETYKFAKEYFPKRNIKIETMLESCGVADFMASATGARNHRIGVEFAKTGKDITVIEDEILNGQRTEGHLAAKEICQILKKKNELSKFPLLTTVYMIVTKQVPCSAIVEYDDSHLEKCQ